MDETGVVEAVKVLAEGPSRTVVLSSGAYVGIRVCNGRTLPLMLDLVANVAGDLGLNLADAGGIEGRLLSKLNDVSFLLKSIAKHTQEVYEVTARTTTLETAGAVADLPVDDLLTVILRVVEVNKDFFMQQVLPLFQKVELPAA